MIKWLQSLPANEPVLLGSAVSAGLTIGASLGLHLQPAQILSVSGAVTAATAWVMRTFVTPTAAVTPPATAVAAAPATTEGPSAQ